MLTKAVYIYIYVCVCVCMYSKIRKKEFSGSLLQSSVSHRDYYNTDLLLK